MSLVALLFILKTNWLFAKMEPPQSVKIRGSCEKTVELKRDMWKRGREGFFFPFLIATASININLPLSTFHASTLAARGPRVHLLWPLIAISSSNDAFSRVTGKGRPGANGGLMPIKSNCAFKTFPPQYPFQWG